MKINKTTIKVIKSDITTLKVDAIVNAANNELKHGGGVAGVISRKGGPVIQKESDKKSPIAIGESVETTGGKLPCQYVIHAVTMSMDFKTDQHKIRAATAAALKCADKLKIKSLAFPALGCGTGGFLFEHAAKIMMQEIYKHCADKTTLMEIQFCLYDDDAYKVFNKIVPEHIKYMNSKSSLRVPYVTVDVIVEISAKSLKGFGETPSKSNDFDVVVDGVVIVERLNPPFGFALPGGFIDYGETLEKAAVREVKEETGLDLKDLKQFHTYSDPKRDPRFQTISTVFTAKGVGKPAAADDALSLRVVPINEILKLEYAFDHKDILKEYLKTRLNKE